MDWDNISRQVNPVIWERGRRYVRDGRVRTLSSDGQGHYQAQVLGTEPYEVTIDVAPDGTLLDCDCDCPYDDGPICKHQVAVLLLIRDARGAPAEPKNTASPSPGLADLLAQQPIDRLVDLLSRLAGESETLAHRIRLELTPTSTPVHQLIAESRRLIRASARAAAGPGHFIDYGDVSGAVEGADRVSARAESLEADGHRLLAVHLSLLIIQEMAGLLDTADDSDGIIGGLIEDSVNRVQLVTAKESEHLSPSDREAVLRALLTASHYPELEGWPDWQLGLLDAAANLAVGTKLKEEWESAAESLGFARGPESISDYAQEQLALIRHRLINRDEGLEAAAQFRSRHLHFKAFRDMAIDEALEAKQYDEAITLAEAGEAQDQSLPGLVRHWRIRRYEATKLGQRLDAQRQVGMELVLDGDVSLYPELKSLHDSREWPAVYQAMLERLEVSRHLEEVYTHILIAEQETARLLAYCQQRPHTIETLYRHLVPTFRAEVITLFQERIQEAAESASSRAHYQGVCQIIRTMARAGAKEQALDTIRGLMARYPRKPAFQDELRQLEQRLSLQRG